MGCFPIIRKASVKSVIVLFYHEKGDTLIARSVPGLGQTSDKSFENGFMSSDVASIKAAAVVD